MSTFWLLIFPLNTGHLIALSTILPSVVTMTGISILNNNSLLASSILGTIEQNLSHPNFYSSLNLVFNSILARKILGEVFTRYDLISGILIGLGATLCVLFSNLEE